MIHVDVLGVGAAALQMLVTGSITQLLALSRMPASDIEPAKSEDKKMLMNVRKYIGW
jgi:hypothetical protein